MPAPYPPPHNFADAFNALRLQKQLREDRTLLERYYVPRHVPRIERFKAQLLVDTSPSKVLYTGHPKSGKSTELYGLIADPEIAKSYFVAFYSIGEDLEIGDIAYIDILLANAIKLYESASAQGWELDREVLADLNVWFQQVTTEVIRETVQGKTQGQELGAKLKVWVAEIGGALRTNAATRTVIREKLGPRTSEVIEKSNFIGHEIERLAGKPVLLVIDDLDKLDPGPGLKVFHGHTQALLRPNFKIVYTVPISLAYSPAFRPIAAQFTDTVVLPSINSRQRDGSPHPPGVELLRNIVLRRMDESLIQERALNHLINNTNGVLSDLLSLAETCCLRAIVAKAQQIDWNMVDEELEVLSAHFKRSLPEAWYPRLAEVHRDKDTAHDDTLWDMLNALAVLEYGPEPWYDIHPAILPLLKAKKLVP